MIADETNEIIREKGIKNMKHLILSFGECQFQYLSVSLSIM